MCLQFTKVRQYIITLTYLIFAYLKVGIEEAMEHKHAHIKENMVETLLLGESKVACDLMGCFYLHISVCTTLCVQVCVVVLFDDVLMCVFVAVFV